MDGRYAERFEQFEERNRLRFCSIESSPKARTRYKRIQSACYNFLERPNGVLSVSYHFTLFGLVVVGLVFAILETMDELKHGNGLMIGTYILEVFLLIVFTSEYILRMWSAGCRSTYSGVLGRLRFAFKPFVIVDMIVIGSTFGVIIYSSNTNLSSSISILRFFQVLRMVRFDRQGGSWKLLGSVLFLHRQELLTTFYIGFCSLIFASFFVYQAEQVDNKTEFGTFADSFWWGVVTLTTVGYGDKVPKSWAGRCVAAFFAIMGISFFALPAGILGSGFALKVSQHQRQKHVKRRRRPAAMLIQCNWRYYASRKNSKLNATWSPFIKYLQEKNSKKDDHQIFEKPTQPVARVRKISIFGRKSSGLSSDGLGRPGESTTFEQVRQRNRKVVRSELFHSNDSLHDGHRYSAGEQHTDDEHGGSHVNHKPILVTDTDGNPSLPAAYKQSIRFTRYLKFLVALRKFKLAKKPYDVKDVIEQYSSGHVEVLGKVKSIGHKIDEALGYKVGTEKVNENPPARTNLVHRLSKLEKQVKTFENKLDQVISLLEDCKRNDVSAQLAEERQSCFVCGHSYEGSHGQHENLQSTETKLHVRRRKLGMTLSNQSLNNHCSLSEREDLVSNEETELRTKACLKSGESMDGCFDKCDSSVRVKIDSGPNYLSPSYGILEERYNDGANYLSTNSCQSSTYGISDNCPSPNPSSSDESYQSKETLGDSHHDDQKFLLPNDGVLPLYCEGYHSVDHETFANVPVHGFLPTDHELCCKPHYDVPSESLRRTGDTFPGHNLSSSQYDENDHGTTANDCQMPNNTDSISRKSCSKITEDGGGLVEFNISNRYDQVPEKILSEKVPASGLVGDNYPTEYYKGLPEDLQVHGEKHLADSTFPQEDQTNEKYLLSTPFACDILYDTNPRTDIVFSSIQKKPCDKLFGKFPQISDSELIISNRTTDNGSHGNVITRGPGLCGENVVQETRM